MQDKLGKGSLLKIAISTFFVFLFLLSREASAGWSFSDTLQVARSRHRATLLPSGKVLVSGGFTTACEVYDPALNHWSLTEPMHVNGYWHTATLLQNGQVLIAGGSYTNPYCELYDPASGIFTPTDSMHHSRIHHTATCLPDGRVLVTGGDSANVYYASCEIYDTVSGTWSYTDSMSTPRGYHTATLLQDGRVLVTGGINQSQNLNSAELYDPARGQWTSAGTFFSAFYHAAALLDNGKVLVAGGFGQGGSVNRSCMLYNPTNRRWESTGLMQRPRARFDVVKMANGQVMAPCGRGENLTEWSCEIYDPSSGQWSFTDSLHETRELFSVTLLQDGRILVAAGRDYQGAFRATCELYESGSGIEQEEVTQAPSRIRLRASPNPFVGYTVVPGHSSELFALYDISGRRVGVYKGDRIGEGLRAGVYFLRAEGGDRKPVRVVKVR